MSKINVNEHGLIIIAMAIHDIIQSEGHGESKGQGIYINNTWLTPETCYWLRKFLDEVDVFSSKNTKDRLQSGTHTGLC